MNRSLCLLFLCGLPLVVRSAPTATTTPDARVAAIAAMLPAEPRGPGVPGRVRAVWDPLATTPEGKKLIDEAAKESARPMPPFDPESYQDFVRNGNRTRYQDQHSKRWHRFQTLVFGECLENQGRFLRAINETTRSLCADPSWLLPAHDRNAEVFKGGSPYVDLGVAMTGYDMALASWLLADKLPAETATLMRDTVVRRVIDPVRKQIAGEPDKFGEGRNWWATANHNWNAVCTAGTVGSLLLLVPDRQERAASIVWAEKNMSRFLSGFSKDGYCTEGIGYWGYGFGHFALLAENVRQQTGGKIDWIASDRVRQIAAAALGLEIVDGQYPVFADAGLGAKPGKTLADYLSQRGCWPGDPLPPPAQLLGRGSLYESITYAFADKAPTGDKSAAQAPPPRTWLPEGGVFIGRPSKPDGLGVALKGGNNAEHHNHNDVGTTMVVNKGQLLLCDPGAMVYTRETFSGDRYRIPVMSSYGHAVPVVDGFLQKDGAKSQGRVLESSFTPESDRLRMDLASCYPESGLKTLERTWTFSRADGGALVIEDRFEADHPIRLGTALIALGAWLDMGIDYLATQGKNGASVTVRIESSAPSGHQVVKINNPSKPSVMRLGVDLKEAQSAGWIRLTIKPGEPAGVKAAQPTKVAGEAPDKLPDIKRAFEVK